MVRLHTFVSDLSKGGMTHTCERIWFVQGSFFSGMGWWQVYIPVENFFVLNSFHPGVCKTRTTELRNKQKLNSWHNVHNRYGRVAVE